jgi:hypothetical protein
MNQEALNKTAVKIAVARLMRAAEAAEREAAAEAQEAGELSYFNVVKLLRKNEDVIEGLEWVVKRRLEELNVPTIWSVKMGLWF